MPYSSHNYLVIITMAAFVRTGDMEKYKSGGRNTYVRSIGYFVFFDKTVSQNVLQCVIVLCRDSIYKREIIKGAIKI